MLDDVFIRDYEPDEVRHLLEGGCDSLYLHGNNWIHGVIQRGALSVWDKTDYNFRLHLAHMWIAYHKKHNSFPGEDLDEATESLAQAAEAHRFLDSFKTFLDAIFAYLFGPSNAWWSPKQHVYDVVAPNYVLIKFDLAFADFAGRKKKKFDPVVLLMRYTEEGWKIAGVNEEEPYCVS